MLEACAVMPLRFGYGLAELPHRLRLCQRSRYGSIDEEGARRSFLQRVGQYSGEVLSRIGRAQLDEQIPGGAELQRIGDAGYVLHRELDAQARDQFERRERIARRASQVREQCECVLRRIDRRRGQSPYRPAAERASRTRR